MNHSEHHSPSHPLINSTDQRFSPLPETYIDNWIGYSVSLATLISTGIVIGLLTGSVVVLTLAVTVVGIAFTFIHVRISQQKNTAMAEQYRLEERLAAEASASRVLDGIKILRSADSLSANARLASAARMVTEYQAAVVFNLRDAQGVLAPSNWSYDGQLSLVRNEYEIIDGNTPGSLAARQGSAIVVSGTDHLSADLPKWAEQAGFRQGIVAPIARGLDTVGVVYALSKSAELPTLKQIEQLELIVSFSSLSAPAVGRESSDTRSQSFNMVDVPAESSLTTVTIRMAGFVLNPDSERIEMDSSMISLSPTEFLLMHALASSPEQPVSPVELMQRCWSKDSQPAENAVDVAIFRLRKKLNKSESGKSLIKTVRGNGYMFVPPAIISSAPVVAD